jgi:hypothetical protein
MQSSLVDTYKGKIREFFKAQKDNLDSGSEDQSYLEFIADVFVWKKISVVKEFYGRMFSVI